MESEHERLARLYAELGDEHLEDLKDDADDLTDEGRMALFAELRKRGLMPEPPHDAPAEVTPAGDREDGFGPAIPGIMPGGASAVEQALAPSGEERLGWTMLSTFYDGHELTRACEALDDSEVEFAIEQKDGDAQSSVPPNFHVWVKSPDLDLAQRVLREKLGLFPLPEIDGEGRTDSDELYTVANFETEAEALEASKLLDNAAIPHTNTAPQPDDEEPWYTIEVAAADLDRALTVVATSMGVVSES